MALRKSNNTKYVLTAISILVVCIMWYGMSSKPKTNAQPDPFGQSKKFDLPTIAVRQDSLVQLLHYFCSSQHSSFSADSSNRGSFSVHINRFSSTPGILFCNSPAIPVEETDGFKVQINPNTKEVDLVFKRYAKGGADYIRVPTDVLCGLMKQHPNIR